MSGDVVIPGNGEESLLIRRLRGTSGTQMPINQDPLDETTITLIETWIDEGALENEVYGCTDPEATNYDDTANVDDGSCTGSYDDFTFAGEYNEHYYYLYNYLADWHTAKIICENNNGHLLTITSEYEDSFISSIISTQSWLGLTDEINEGQWNWITGEPLTYTNWDGSEPNGGTEENYLERHPSGKWNDLRSGQSLSFILELESGYGCTDNAACNYDPVATWNDGSCTDYCGASNLSVIDIPNDQGGYVYLSFNKSVFDTETLNASPDGTTEGYLIERSDSGVWTGILSIYAYGEDLYQVEARTLADSTSISDALTEYRVIAAMQEGNFLSDTTVTGYSVDNIAPTPPSSFLGLYDGSNNQAVLSWNQSEANDISHYNVYRNAELQGATTETSFTDEMTEDTEYAVSAVDIHENESGMSESVLVEMPDMNVIDNLIPTEYALKAAYPNPFNPVTNITYGLPEYTNVQIVIFDLSGKQVETLINEFQTPGYHSVNWNADNLPSGVYLIRMDSGEFTQIQKVVLVK